MKPYPKYKPSGVEWIGDIPEHWNLSKLKYEAIVILGKMLTTEQKVDYKLAAYLRAQNASWLKVDVTDIKKMWFSPKEMEKLKLQKDDLIICEGGEVGRTSIWNNEIEECYIQNSVHKVTIINDNCAKYFLYLFFYLGKRGYFDSIINRISIGHLTYEKLKEVLIFVPPANEQKAISFFIDYKSSQIDRLIFQKNKLIELLQEEKTAIINEAVTKGLNPDVKMKDSGIPWLGEIPKHWEMKKIKYISKIILGKMLTNENKGGLKLKPYLRAQNLGWLKVNSEDIKEMWFSDDEIEKLRLRKNDLLVSEGGEVGRTCMWQEEIEECYIQNSVHRISFYTNNNPYFFLYLLYDYGINKYFNSIINKISIGHLTKEKLKEILVIIPPKAEQDSIVKKITMELSRIRKIEDTVNKEITLLQEYRTALISEAVTGKIDVRDINLSQQQP